MRIPPVNRRDFLRVAALAPFALRASSALAAARSPVALVTCDTEARIAVVDLRSLRVVDSIPTLPDPRSLELVGDLAVVCHTAVGALSIVDGRRVRHVLRGVEEPRYTAAHPDGVHAFVTDSGRSGVVLVDVRRGRILDRLPLPGWARHVTISRDGGTVWAGLGTASEHVAVVRTAPLRHAGQLAPGFPAHDVGHAPDGRLWITSGEQRLLAAGRAVLPADLAPQHVTFGAGRVFVTSGDSGTLHVLTPAGRVLVRRPVAAGSYNVQFGANRVVTPSLDHGTLTVLDPSGRLLGVVAVADSCHDACILG
jgi:DNA-binding beta-propeller fold protein YncE